MELLKTELRFFGRRNVTLSGVLEGGNAAGFDHEQARRTDERTAVG